MGGAAWHSLVDTIKRRTARRSGQSLSARVISMLKASSSAF